MLSDTLMIISNIRYWPIGDIGYNLEDTYFRCIHNSIKRDGVIILVIKICSSHYLYISLTKNQAPVCCN